MPSIFDDPEAYAFSDDKEEDLRRKLTNHQAFNAMLQGVGDLPYSLLGAPVELGTGLLRSMGMAQGEQVGGIDYIKRKATELGIRPPDSTDPTMRDMRMGAEIVSGAIDPTRVARVGGVAATAAARKAAPMVGNAIENYMAKSGLAPRIVPEGGLLGSSSKSMSDIKNKFKDVSLDVYEKNNTINLSRIVVPKDVRNSGIGSDVMQDLVSYADETGQKVALTPSSDFGGNVKKLKEFYKRFGFVENKGKNKDFSTRESMIRPPENIALPARQQEISGAQSGLLDATPVNNVTDTLIFHGTSPSAAKSIEKAGFDVAQSADGTIWFTTNPAIGEVAATAKGAVVSRNLNESNLKLATWDDIDKYSVDELMNMGYDGVKMPSGNETTYQIFNPEKLTKLNGKSAAPQTEALKVAQSNAALPVEQGGLGLPANNTPMDRAKAMGFDVDANLFHATDKDFTEFQPSTKGKLGAGVYAAPSPRYAEKYVDQNARVMPILSRAKMAGNDERIDIADGIREALYAKDKDFSVQDWKNKTTTALKDAGYGGIDMGVERVIFDPSNIRSQFAAFDPLRKNDADLLAGIGAGGLLAVDDETKQKVRSLLGYPQ
tara:strand:+ start:6343 stop:8151 length:1809 start_codon:yes stop_codon:yes gene_type:complete